MAAVASTSAASSSSTSRLEPLLLVARSTKPRGAAAANLIHQAISAPAVFFFGELFDIPGVAELSNSTDAQLGSAYQLLCLFAYGTYSDYTHLLQSGSIPNVSTDQVQKLRQLTLLSLACQNKALSYTLLSESLGISGTDGRELEDLIIETIYAGLISGKLNELQSRFEVHHVQGRDVPHPSLLSQSALSSLPSLSSGAMQMESIFASLSTWQSTTTSVLESLHSRMEGTRASAAETTHQNQQHHQALLQNLIESQHQLEAQQQQQHGKKGKGVANAMDVDESDGSRAAARKKAAPGSRGNKRSRA
ncbi:PCI domain-containing protein [Pseudozyma hubeiensis]|nr:PCI domain-containing protein [Pseudozyma hubeiensis]